MILKNKLSKVILITSIFAIGSYFVPLPSNGIIKSEIVAEAAQTKYTHNHNGYTCYKITSYMSYANAKKMVDQSKQINNLTTLLGIAGGSYKGWAGGLIKLYGYNITNQMAPFRTAVSKKKGVEYTYVAHFSNSTTDTYSTDFKYTYK